MSVDTIDTIRLAIWESCDAMGVLDSGNVHAGIHFEEMLGFEQESHMLDGHAKDKRLSGYDHELS
jgi:hypothetical protein